jgi:hypothetical protein
MGYRGGPVGEDVPDLQLLGQGVQGLVDVDVLLDGLVDLLLRVTTVSVRSVEITRRMQGAPRQTGVFWPWAAASPRMGEACGLGFAGRNSVRETRDSEIAVVVDDGPGGLGAG